MIEAKKPLVADWYTPLSEKEAPTPTRFLIRPLDGVEILDVKFRKDALGNLYLDSAGARAALKYGLQGWENFADKSGPVFFSFADRDANLARFSPEVVTELATEIYVRSVLSEEERKN